MLRLVGFLLLGVSLAHAVSYQVLVEEQWQNFKLEHGKFYQSEEEEQHRQRIFMQNLHQVTHHNKLYEMGLTSYKMRINHFGDLTGDEFLKLYTVQMPELSDFPQDLNSSDIQDYAANFMDLPEDMNGFVNYEPASAIDVNDLPQDVDWTTKGMVTPVKNQGQCGSCWSFSATGALEAQWFKKTGRLVSLSEQNLVDCSWHFGNRGCNGGWMHWAFDYIKSNGGIDTEQAYPYQARSGFCHYSPANKGATVRGVIQFRGEAQLQAKVSSVGPIAIAAEVGHNFQHYYSGVYDEPRCGHRLNHAMLVVGYGSEGGREYWLVKNSWGASWGSRGYIKMSRHKNNQCGIADAPSYPLV